MKIVTIILGVLTTLLGGYCIFRPGLAALSLAWLLGIMLVISGINIAINYFAKKIGSGWDAFFGILSILSGIVLLSNYYGAFFADTVIVYFIVAFVLISGILRVMGSWKMKKRGLPWLWSMIFGIISILIAIVAMFHPLMGVALVGYMVAFSIMTQGINTLCLGLSLKNKDL